MRNSVGGEEVQAVVRMIRAAGSFPERRVLRRESGTR